MMVKPAMNDVWVAVATLAISAVVVGYSSSQAVDPSVRYLGQPPPGTTPARFAPGIVSTPAIEASMAADLVVHMQMEGTIGAQFEAIRHGGALPRLPDFHINMYVTRGPRGKLAELLAQRFRGAYAELHAVAAE